MKGQASTEFVILTAFLLLFFIIFTLAVQSQILSAKSERNDELVSQLYNIIDNEALLASEVNPGYRREFFLPADLDGSPYDLTLNRTNKQDLTIDFRGDTYLFFINHSVTILPLEPGLNVIFN